MDQRRFDSLARLIGGGASRRSVLRGMLGLGGGAVASVAGAELVDARTSRTRPTVPPPSEPGCQLPQQMCGGACCDGDKCKDGLCCPNATDVICGGACCASGLCAGGTCCAPGDEVCGAACCAPAAPEPYSGQTSTCARDGNADYCCQTGWQCGLDCCAYEHQCCDQECCGSGAACLGTVYGGYEEYCCPIPQICDGGCCEGTCFDPAATVFPSFDPALLHAFASCCPTGGNVCAGAAGTLCCEAPSDRCCVRADSGNAQCLTVDQCCYDDECTATGPDACLAPTCEVDGTCSYAPDDARCTETGEDACLVGSCSAEGACSYAPDNSLCTETGDGCLAGTCSATGVCSYAPVMNGTPCGTGGTCDDGVCVYCAGPTEACAANDDCCSGACICGTANPNTCAASTAAGMADGTIDTTAGPFTRFGGYTNVFPTGGWSSTIEIYLDMSLATGQDQRFAYTVAANAPDCLHRRDFVFSVGTKPGTPGSFIMSASNNSPGWPSDPGRSPLTVSTTGWYTFTHTFADNGSGVLSVTMSVNGPGGSSSWTLSDPTDVIGTTVGGSRYGWFSYGQFSSLAIQNNSLSR